MNCLCFSHILGSDKIFQLESQIERQKETVFWSGELMAVSNNLYRSGGLCRR